jgi:hypothetical protein
MDGAAEAVQWVTQNEEGISYVKKLGQGGYGEVHKVLSQYDARSNAKLRNGKTYSVPRGSVLR